MTNSPKENLNIGSEAPPSNEENVGDDETQMEGEGSTRHHPHGESDPGIKNH
jgi:hypothetical protein